MVMTARALDAQRPQPSAAGGMLRVADGVTFIEADDGAGAVFLWGTVAWCWAAGDRVARRLAAVQLVETKAARQRQVAAAFGVNEDSLILWRGEYAANGAIALAGRRPGPKGPSKLTEAKRVEIGGLRAEGLTLTAVAAARWSFDRHRAAGARSGTGAGAGAAAPADDRGDRQVPADLLLDAPEVPTGRAVPLAGALVVLPALAATGLLDAVAHVYDRGRTGLSRLRSLMGSMVLPDLLGEPDDGLSGRQTAAVGRLLGFGRALDVETVRRWVRELAALGRAASLLDALARRRLDTDLAPDGILHVAGVARAYRGAVALDETDLARIRLSMGTQVDARAFDRGGDGVLVWSTHPDASGVDALRAGRESRPRCGRP